MGKGNAFHFLGAEAMLTYLLSHLKSKQSQQRAERKARQLNVQPRESRAMMTMPALSSLHNAQHRSGHGFVVGRH